MRDVLVERYGNTSVKPAFAHSRSIAQDDPPMVTHSTGRAAYAFPDATQSGDLPAVAKVRDQIKKFRQRKEELRCILQK